MARTISKSIASATIHVFDPMKPYDVDENGMPMANVHLACDGSPSQNKARILAEKACKSKNVMVMSIEVDESKLTVDPDTFYAQSEPCIEGSVYGREYVTQTFKSQKVSGFYMSDGGMKPFSILHIGVTTDSKLVTFVREELRTQMAVIKTAEVVEERRFMTRERYLELAR